jgi:hypothetical protein
VGSGTVELDACSGSSAVLSTFILSGSCVSGMISDSMLASMSSSRSSSCESCSAEGLTSAMVAEVTRSADVGLLVRDLVFGLGMSMVACGQIKMRLCGRKDAKNGVARRHNSIINVCGVTFRSRYSTRIHNIEHDAFSVKVIRRCHWHHSISFILTVILRNT